MPVLQFVLQLDTVYYLLAGAGAAAAAAMALLVRLMVRRRRFAAAFRRLLAGEIRDLPAEAAGRTSRNARKIASLLEGADPTTARDALYHTGIAAQWVDRLRRRPRKVLFQGVLRHDISEGFFACFRYALEKKKYRRRLDQWMDRNRTRLPLLVIVHSTAGERFDGRRAFDLFRDKLEEIRDLLGDPDWRGRYFALKVLLNDRSETTRSLLFDLFADSHPLIRRTMVEEYPLPDEKQAGEVYFDLALRDPHPVIRRAARDRFRERFDRAPWIDLEGMEPAEIAHLVEMLNPDHEEDEALAAELLLHRNAEIRYHAARFLEGSGALNRFCARLDMADARDYRRKTAMLKNAANAGVTGFLKKCLYAGTRESLLLVSEILVDRGDVALAGNLIRLARDRSFRDVYRGAVRAIVKRGDLDEKSLLREELYDHLHDDLLPVLAEELAPLGEGLFIDPLLEALEKRGDQAGLVRRCLAAKDRDALVARLVEIVKDGDLLDSGRDTPPCRRRLQVQSLLLLAELGEEYCLAFLFEHLPLLPVDQVAAFARAASRYPREALGRLVAYYLGRTDGQIRANLIALIPTIGIPDFLDQVRSAQNDADPLVRIASVFALVEMEDTRSYTQALHLLRDPVEEVRAETARALGLTGRKAVLDRMKQVFFDPDEVPQVKRAVITGASASRNPRATDMLVDFLERDRIHADLVKDELTGHTGRANVEALMERMKDGGASLKKELEEVFARMGPACKPALLELLASSLSAYREYAGRILDDTGGTEEEIVKLKHRDPAVRREAARLLSLIGTVKAFRGLVMASRDPDQEVRVNVVRALEKLETPEGETVLRALEDDPDPRIRKYTHWAMERLRAKELV
jgi:HEAT repeat protein